MYSLISLFAGIGGIDLGFKQAGFNIIWANEIDHAACMTYRYNFGSEYLVEDDIRNIAADSVPKADVLSAGFPCQAFSIAGKKQGFKDARGQLFFQVMRVAEAVHPKVIFLENVENLMEHDGGRTFQVIYTSLVSLGYFVHFRAMPTHEYANIPQTRRRVYIVATDDYGFSGRFQFPEPIPLTVKAIDWIDQKSKQADIYYFTGKTVFERHAIETVRKTDSLYRAYHDVITIAKNYTCPTLTASIYKPHNSIMVRDRFGVRRLTLHECLKFQGFPEDYYFPQEISLADAYRQIGNSVTVPVVRRIAERIKNALE